MITISRDNLKRILHAATGDIKHFVMAEDQFINEWLKDNPDVSDSNSSLSGIISESEANDVCLACDGTGEVEGDSYDDIQPCRNC